jgi:hypothetical protein
MLYNKRMKLGDLKDGELIPHELDKPSETSELRHIDKSVKNSDVIQRYNKRVVDRELIKTSTENLKFRVTPAMRIWIDTAVNIISDSPSEISKNCGVRRETYYHWMKVEGFEQWYLEQYKARRSRWVYKLDRIGMDRAKKSYDYWHDMNIKAGEQMYNESNSQPRQAISILGGMTVQTINNNNVTPVDETSTKE